MINNKSIVIDSELIVNGSAFDYTKDEEFEGSWKGARKQRLLVGSNLVVRRKVCVPKGTER